MSPLARFIVRPSQAAAPALRLAAAPRASFHAVSALRLNEDSTKSAEELEKAKKAQLRDGENKEPLKSQSEAGLHADKQDVKDHDSHMEKLQKETAQQTEKEHPAGKA